MWRGQEDFTVICTIYRLNIKIYKPDGQPPTVLVPLTDMPNPTNLPEGKVADLMILHEDECHFNLIVPRDGSLATEGGLDFQRSVNVRLRNEGMLNVRSTQEERNKDALIEKLKTELKTLKLEKQKLERVIEEIKMDGSGAKAVHRRSGESRDYDKEDLETFDSELTTPAI